MSQPPRQPPEALRARPPEQAPKLGAGLVRSMLARGATELARGLGLHGHAHGRTVHELGGQSR